VTSAIAPVRWEHDRLVLLDQRLLPGQELERVYGRWEDVAEAIRTLAVR
jgi:methylthioribose-1-phosphate isomerase